ncbi:MAG TPA: hemolysin family protein [Bacteroidota bacterium]|nr:hemolysin family protein [Bacteroidota bacterium]
MISQIVGNIIFIFLLVLTNAFFVAAEFAIVKVRSSQLRQRIEEGSGRAVLAQHIIDHLDAYLSAIQLGVTLASLGLGWIGEPLLADMLRQPFQSIGIVGEQTLYAVSIALSFAFLTFLQIILGELAPKALAIQSPESTALAVAFPLQFFYRIFRPIIWLLNSSANFLLRLVGIQPASGRDLVRTAEELEHIVAEGARSGVFNKTEQELISSIFEFSVTTAKEIMVPRTEVVAIQDTISRERLMRIVTEEGYSRMPIYKDSIDNIIGIIYTKDLISLLEHRDVIVFQDIIRPAYFVPDAVKISQLMKNLQERKMHMAIVIDEFGGTEGIVTMEDILEEIVGEIHDEYDEVLKEVEQSADGSSLVNARMSIKDFNEKFSQKLHTEIPEDPEYETVNGFLTRLTGRIPEISEDIRFGDLRFTVMKKSPRRLRQIKLVRVPPSPTSENGTGAETLES